ncbi:MAG: CDP-alcohol phosphatidyltransferase family protein [Eubacteriales bacterium]|nr:CDP-alcohol phosphatidyltransferase family protein [Eubacteriales bacterium]
MAKHINNLVNSGTQQNRSYSMIYFLKDLPNIVSLVGLFCALLSICFAFSGQFHLALIGILWAVLFDWADGIIARRTAGRTDVQRHFGSQLDSLIDIVSFGVFPSVFLFSYARFNLWFLPGSFLILAASAIRLSYFNVFGMIDKKTYQGLALDNNVLLLAALFMLERFFSHICFSIILYVFFMILLILNLSSVRTYKFSGRWFFVLIGYVILMTVLYSLII